MKQTNRYVPTSNTKLIYVELRQITLRIHTLSQFFYITAFESNQIEYLLMPYCISFFYVLGKDHLHQLSDISSQTQK